MTNFKIGDKIPISALLTITGEQHKGNGRTVYQLSNGLCVPDFILGQMEIKEQKKSVEAVTEDKPEPIKLYCVKDDEPGEWLTKGKIYEVANGIITFDDGFTDDFRGYGIDGLAGFIKRNKQWDSFFVPLVKRQAMVGEWVLVTDGTHPAGKKGKIVRCDSVDAGVNMWCRFPDDRYDTCMNSSRYLVLDGYQPEPEFKPYLSSDGDNYGEVGEKTNYKDAVGRELYVGDVVELFRDGESRGLRCVVKTMEPDSYCKGKRFVMGIESDCNDKDGTIKSYQVLKSRGFETLKHGEVINGIKYRGEAQ